MEAEDKEARRLVEKLMERLNMHEDGCNKLRLSQMQFQESAKRTLEDMKELMRTHTTSDETFQGLIYKKLDGWTWAVFKTLVGALTASFGVIGIFVWRALYP